MNSPVFRQVMKTFSYFLLVLDVADDGLLGNMSDGLHIVGTGPHRGQLALQVRELLALFVTDYDTICLETLNMRAMQRMWGRKVSDLGFSEFANILARQCKKYGKKLIQINQWEATSKTCSVCGHHENEMPLNIRKWICPECGTHHDRDVNAAQNILRVGTSTLGRGNGRPALVGSSR